MSQSDVVMLSQQGGMSQELRSSSHHDFKMIGKGLVRGHNGDK